MAEEKSDSPLQGWSILAYRGQTAQTIFMKLMRFKEPRPFRTYIATVEASILLKKYWDARFQFEWGNNLTRRFEKGFQDDFFEINSFLILRWQSFPWHKYLYTTVAVGEGLSYAHRVPYIESHDTTNSKKTSRVLNFLSWEITAALPKCPDWSLVYRLHHRSGIFGIFNGVSGGSNVTAFGIRYTYLADCGTFW